MDSSRCSSKSNCRADNVSVKSSQNKCRNIFGSNLAHIVNKSNFISNNHQSTNASLSIIAKELCSSNFCTKGISYKICSSNARLCKIKESKCIEFSLMTQMFSYKNNMRKRLKSMSCNINTSQSCTGQMFHQIKAFPSKKYIICYNV